MTVTTVVLGSVLGAALIWGLIISGISSLTHQIIGYSGFDAADTWVDELIPEAGGAYASQDQLMRTWSMSPSGYYGETIIWLTFEEDEIYLELQSASGTEEYGSFDYVMVSEDAFYVPDAGQTFSFEINQGNNMLTISPGLFSGASEEYWFNFSVLP